MPNHICVHSEIGRLNTVLIHQPGPEMENMTPATAADVLFDDILNLDLALAEHRQLTGVLRRVADVLEFSELLEDILADEKAKLSLLRQVCELHRCQELVDDLMAIPAKPLARQLFEGTLQRKDSFEKFLNPSPHAIPPLPNAFFTRDASMCVYDQVVIGSMAHKVRLTESLLLRAIFKHHPKLKGHAFLLDGTQAGSDKLTVEGGDVLVIREDLVVLGYSERTSPQAIDFLARQLSQGKQQFNVIAVELPKQRATIHLDMIFTMLDVDTFMIFPPLITGAGKCKAYHMQLQDGKVTRIDEYSGLPKALRRMGMEINMVPCGGQDPFRQEREQWTSGANFFAFAPGQVLGFAHNTGTLEALSQAGYEVVHANEIITDKKALGEGKIAVAMDGAELSRGGGGCRCMTMPICRQPVAWPCR